MLNIPEKGVRPSVTEHNSDIGALADWIEASVLFDDAELSDIDIADTLYSEQIYQDRQFASEMIDSVFCELRRREGLLSPYYSIHVEGKRLVRAHKWNEVSAYSFCLFLSLALLYPKWMSKLGKNYNEQGFLFEELTKVSLEKSFIGWRVDSTGWARTRPNKIAQVVHSVAESLCESVGPIEQWVKPKAKDAGLDLVLHRPFSDARAATPVFMFQCASGTDWEEKRCAPNMDLWGKLIQFTSTPKKAFAVPFALSHDDFRISCGPLNGVLFDRYRLLEPGITNIKWMPPKLNAQLLKWMSPRVKKLTAQMRLT